MTLTPHCHSPFSHSVFLIFSLQIFLCWTISAFADIVLIYQELPGKLKLSGGRRLSQFPLPVPDPVLLVWIYVSYQSHYHSQTPSTGLRHPSTTAVFSYVIGSRKLSADEEFFYWYSNSSKFVTNNSDYIRCLFYNSPCWLRQLKSNQNRLNRDGTHFLPGMDASQLSC